VIGYWDYRDADGVPVSDAIAATPDDRVVTTLSDALAEIEAALSERRDAAHGGTADETGPRALTAP
jgi:hypothetical protein